MIQQVVSEQGKSRRESNIIHMFLSPRMGRNTNEHCQNEDRVPNKVHPSKPKLRPLPCLVSCVLVLSCFHILLLSCVNAILCKNASDSE